MSENVKHPRRYRFGNWTDEELPDVFVSSEDYDALLAERDALKQAGEGLLWLVVGEWGDPAKDEDVADLSWLVHAVAAWRTATGEDA